MTATAQISAIDPGEEAVNLQWEDGHRSVFHYCWLRDNCPSVRHPQNQQRRVDVLATLAAGARPGSVSLTPSGTLRIRWSGEAHTSEYEPRWLRSHCYSGAPTPAQPTRRLWDRATLPEHPQADYGQLFSSEETLLAFLKAFRALGFGIIHGVPTQPGQVLQAALKLGSFIRGQPWHVQIDEDPEYISYSNLPLSVHTDDSYRDAVPSVHLMHCLRAAPAGGETILTDGFKVAAVLREQAPEKFQLLSELPIPIRFRGADRRFDYEINVPILSLDRHGELETIRFASAHQQPLKLPPHLMAAYYEALLTFSRMCADPAFQARFTLGPGDLHLADNHRILHGRTAFPGASDRHIEGCYIERSDIDAQINRLSRALRARGD